MKKRVITSQVEDYLASRRIMGFELQGEGYQLHSFARFAEQQRHSGAPTLDLALRWAQGAQNPGPVTAARRLEVIRPFFAYCRQFDPAGALIPTGVCGSGHRRLAPHIYSDAEINALLNAAQELKPAGLRPLTCATLFGLLAATGMRISEALHLKRSDLKLGEYPAITIRETKFKKSRLIPIHITTAQALAAYRKAAVGIQRAPGVDTFFITATGQSVSARTVRYVFDSLRQCLGWVARGGHLHPRIHDLRHTFICRALLSGEQGLTTIDHVVDAVSTYVGHAKVSDTYWYISATPELMSTASLRFSRFSSGDSQ